MTSRRNLISLVSAFVIAAAAPAFATCKTDDSGRIALTTGDRAEIVALAEAGPTFTSSGQPAINLALCAESAPVLAELTSDAIGEQMALTLDGNPVWTAVIAQPILSGSFQVTGGFTATETTDLARRLRAAANLPG